MANEARTPPFRYAAPGVTLSGHYLMYGA